MWPSQVVHIRTALKPAAFTLSKVAWVHLSFPHTVSEATPLLMASIWLPMFQPGAIALNTVSGVMAVALAVEMGWKASRVILTLTFSFPHSIVTVPLLAESVLLAAAERVTMVS